MRMAVSIDGVLVDPAEARVPVLDRGLLYGDSAFEVLRTYRGQPLAVQAHLARLSWSCERLGIPAPDALRLRAELEVALAAAHYDESYIRVIVTRGVTAVGLALSADVRPRRIIVVLPLAPQPPALYAQGVEVATVSTARSLDATGAAGAKVSNYLPNILALEAARARGAYEAISVAAGGELLEGSTSNLFVVQGGVVRTPPLGIGILGGITRQLVLRAAAAEGIELAERLLFPPDLYGAEEAFITSTLREMVPVVRADGLTLGEGMPGPVTRRLHAALRREVELLLDQERVAEPR